MNVRLERKVELELFGSCRNGFGLDNCDLDINLTIQGLSFCGIEATRGDYMERISEVIRDNPLVYSLQILPSTSNGVPELKFLYNLYGKKYTCHLFFYNMIAIYHTDLLRTYSLIDPRASALGCLIKYWARRHNLLGYPMVPSYAWTLMVIHYLQQKKVLPYLQEIAINNSSSLHPITNSNQLISNQVIGGRGHYYPMYDSSSLGINSWDGISSSGGQIMMNQPNYGYNNPNYGHLNYGANYSSMNTMNNPRMMMNNPNTLQQSYSSLSAPMATIGPSMSNMYSNPGYSSMNGFHGNYGVNYNVVNQPGLGMGSGVYDMNCLNRVPIYSSMNRQQNMYGQNMMMNNPSVGYINNPSMAYIPSMQPPNMTSGMYSSSMGSSNPYYGSMNTMYDDSSMYRSSMMPYNDATCGVTTLSGFLPKVMVHGCNVYFFRDVNMLPHLWPDYGVNQETLTSLLYGFFEYYSTFDYDQYVISIRENPFCVPTLSHSIVVEDPFIIGRNITSNITSGVLMYHIKSSLMNARNELRVIIRSRDGNYMTGEQIIGCLK